MLRNAILEMAELEGEDLTEENLDTLVEALLDELSKDTLKSYMKKSIHSSAAAWRDADGNVLNRLPKDASKTISKRYKGQSSAERKLAKEETEELDELSKSTLSSYVIKATHPSRENSISNLASKGGFKNASTSAGSDDDKDPNKNGEKEDSKAAKRSYGVIRAVSKLTKEDVINRTIEKYIVSEADLPTPEDRLVAKLDGLSETHVNTLLTVFNSLNEDNQMKMLSTAETQEGILNLLDFAIQNKEA